MVIPSDIDESDYPCDGITSTQYAENLAFAKANDVAQKYPQNLVIGADTIADFNGEIIGKPRDAQHAEEITKKLFRSPHKVITGIAVIKIADNIKIIESDITIVYPRKMSSEQIAEHIKGGSWQGKAGAYAIQETGDEFVEKIEGNLTNVMGLPMELLQKILNRVL